jgi:hypothetical protein
VAISLEETMPVARMTKIELEYWESNPLHSVQWALSCARNAIAPTHSTMVAVSNRDARIISAAFVRFMLAKELES